MNDMISPATRRKRRQREKEKAANAAATPAGPTYFVTDDWQQFIKPGTLPQKAGCEPDQIGRAVLKELTDNGLDNDADTVTVEGDEYHCIVSDDGPGIDPAMLGVLFSVNRPLVSSKLKRLPLRGMLGNGLRVVMGAVAAFNGTITVATRGRHYTLATDRVTGHTEVTPSRLLPGASGTTVELRFPRALFDDESYWWAREAIRLAGYGTTYRDYSQAGWYSPEDLLRLVQAAPDSPPDQVIAEVFGIDEAEFAPTLDWARTFISAYAADDYVDDGVTEIGYLGIDALGGYYAEATGSTVIDGATIPFCVEAWVTAEPIKNPGDDDVSESFPLINRSFSLAHIDAQASSFGLHISGCGLRFWLTNAKRALYDIDLAVTAPLVQLTTDGKAPHLVPFCDAIEKVLRKAAGEAYRNMTRPRGAMSIADAARQVMEEAYLKASDNGTLPAKARQIMYAARGGILELTGRAKFDDKYFTQVLLPDYIGENPEATADWDVVYDARGNLTEPHTGRTVPLGTIAVREYLGERQPRGSRVRLADGLLHPTSGPRNRFKNIVFIEKEGFDELFEAVQLAECYDLAIMSTKGMSVVASRKLLDEVASLVEHIFVLHDFDLSGFSIKGTLGTDARRYKFTHDVESKIIDIGLRLSDVAAMGLESERVKIEGEERPARRLTLVEHGASRDEVEFLAPLTGECRRVELNAMTSRQLVDYVEAALRQHGVQKVVPDDAVLEEYWRQRRKVKLIQQELEAIADDIADEVAAAEVPKDLAAQVRKLLEDEPTLAWDMAVARIIG